MEDFCFTLWDFQQNPVGDLTVEEMFKITGLTRLRFYLVSTEKTCTNSINSQSTIIGCDSTPVCSTAQLVLSFNNHETSVSHRSESEESLPGFTFTQTLPVLSFAEHEEPQENFESTYLQPRANNYNELVHEIFDCSFDDVENTARADNVHVEETYETLNDILKNFQQKINMEKVNQFNVFRENVFSCCVRAMRRKTFDPFKKISVKFSDLEGNSEGAIDEGGPTREMFRLVLSELASSNLFTGINKKNISLNNNALHDNLYFEATRIVSLSLLHGGPGPHFMSKTLFTLISKGIESTNIKIADLEEEEVKTKLSLFEVEDDLNKLQEMILEDPLFSIAGCHYIYSVD